MTGYAAAMEERQPSRAPGGLDMFRALETLRYQKDLAQAKPSLDNPAFSWYPVTRHGRLEKMTGRLEIPEF